MFNAANILEALKNYIRTRGGTSNAYNIAEAVNDLNSIPQGSGGDIPSEVSNAIETHGMGWTDEEEIEGFDIQWDGNTESLDVINDIFYKVSNNLDGIKSKSDLIGATMVIEGGEPLVITDDNVFTSDNKVYALGMALQYGIVVALEDGMFDEDIPISKGIWFVEISEAMYVSRLYKEATTEEVVHQIDQKYIPQGSGGGAMVVNFSIEYSEGEYIVSSDKTPTEVLSAALTGPVVGVATINVSDTIRTMPLGNVVYTLSNIAAFLPIGIDDDGNFVYFVYADSDGWAVNQA